MEFESPDVEKDFPGLYASESGGKKSESDFSDDSHEKHKKDLLRSKDKKESKKDRGYAALEGESSPDEAESDMKSPSKSKKTKSFKFPSKKEKREKSREKEGGREAEQQKDLKEKKKDKETTRTSKLRSIKDKKLKSKLSEEVPEVSEEPPVFGVTLEEAVTRSRCHDGVPLPLVVRNCLDFIEECGLTVDGIYKSSGNKSRAQQLRKSYNQKDPVSFIDCDPVTVAGLLKLFLRELPEPIISTGLVSEFEDSANKKGEGLEALLLRLPLENRELLGWMVLHCKHLVANEKLNKCGGLQGVCTTFAPLLQTSTKVLSALICYSASLFPNLQLSRYIPPLSGPSPALPSTEAGCKEELKKLESLLAQVHGEMNAGLAGQRREEQLWDAQRIVTQLKRKLRTLQKPLEPRASDDELRMDLSLRVEEEAALTSLATAVTATNTAPTMATISTVTTTTATVHVPPPEPVVSESTKEKEKEKEKTIPEAKSPVDISEPVKETQTVPEETTKEPSQPAVKESPTKEVAEVLPEEDVQDSAIDLEREELEQRALQLQLETLAEELAERVVKERTEVHRLRLEVARVRENNTERTPDSCDTNDMNLAELLEKNENLQEERDTLCRLITAERKAIAWTKAMIALKLEEINQLA